MKNGTINIVANPLRERDVIGAVCACIELDRQQRLRASRQVELSARFATLTPRQRQVMALVSLGKLNKQVGVDLGLSEVTVKAHRGALMRKMGARTVADLVRMAEALGDELAPRPKAAA